MTAPVADAGPPAPSTPPPAPSSAREAGATSERLAAVDGLRGLAIAAVVLFHLGALRGGFLGVDLFFVVSGFLITRQLVARSDLGTPRRGLLRWFWGRRVRRLLPTLLVVLAATLAWVQRVGSDPLVERTREQAAAGLLQVANWWDLRAGDGYWAVARARTPLNHLWSLAIEEQFYLLWPLVVLALTWGRRGRTRLLAVALLGAVASFGAQWQLAGRPGTDRAYLGTDARVGAILLGAALAVWAATDRPGPGRFAAAGPARLGRRTGLISVLGAVVLAGLAYAWVELRIDRDLFRGQLVACSIAAAVVLAVVVHQPQGPLARVLAAGPLTLLGRLSYALYLWHVPVIVLLTEERTGFGSGQVLVFRVVIIAVATAATHLLVERPIHRHGWVAPVRGRALRAGLVIVLASGLLLPELRHEQRSTLASSTERPTTAPLERSFTVAEVEALKVMVVGDSWGLRTEGAMAEMAAPRPATVIQASRPSCGIADPVAEVAGNGAVFSPEADCLTWRDNWRGNVERNQPDVAVLQVGNWDQAPQQLEPGGAFVQPCDQAFADRYADHLDEAIAILAGTDTAVFVATVRDGEGDARARSDCMNRLLLDGVGRDTTGRVHVLDLRGFLCPGGACSALLDGRPVYDDTGHVAEDQVDTVNAWIFGQIGNILGTQVPPVDHWP